MKKQNKLWICLILMIVLAILSGCAGLIETAEVGIVVNPNPVPFNSEDGGWWYYLTFDESNGIGVTLISLRFDGYSQAEELIYTNLYYEEDIIDWFGSNYIPAFSTLSEWVRHTGTNPYTIITVRGVDDDNNRIVAIGRADYLSK
ncbi:hypothetical protein ES708_34106 [subsurface metagenome]